MSKQCNMVGVAQLVEHRIVAPGVVGSIPIVHPIFEKAPGTVPGVFVSGAVSRGRGGIGRHTGFRFQRRKA